MKERSVHVSIGTRAVRLLMAAVVAVVGLVVAPTPAAASDNEKVCSRTRVIYGYRGIVKCGTVHSVTWPGGQKESFAIAPNRAIYHVWPHSGGWKVMPGNGRADQIHEVNHEGTYMRYVVVEVAYVGYYYNEYWLAEGHWTGWSR